MIPKKLWRAVFLALPPLLLSPPLLADYVDDMVKLYEQGQAEAAYRLAEEHLLEGEGDPRFDFHYGLAAIDTGRLNQGVFALERYLLAHPDELRARLELGRAYFFLEQHDQARREFERVLAADPPAQVKENIERFLDTIRLRESRYRTTSGYFVELGLGYDTNVNNAPGEPEFWSPVLGNGTIDPGSLSEEDAYLDVAAGFNISHPVRPGINLFAGADGYYKLNQTEGDYDIGTANIKGGVTMMHNDETFRLILRGQNYQVGGDDYRDAFLVSGDWRHRIDGLSQVLGFVQWADFNYPDNELRDSQQTILGIGASRLFAGDWRPQLSGSLYAGQERASQSGVDAATLVDRDMLGARLSVQVNPQPKVSVDLSAQWQRSDYQEEDFLFLRNRKDDFYLVELGATWLFQRHWSLRGTIGYSENNSNIAVDEYDRLNTRLSVRYEF